MELQRFFGIYDILNESNAKYIYDRANEMLQGEGFSACGFINRSNVSLICTTDDPLDTLEHHKKIREQGKVSAKVLPTFRPDKVVNINLETFVHVNP